MPPPSSIKLSDLVEIYQGKNPSIKQKDSDSLSLVKKSFLTLNSIDFDYYYFDKAKLLTVNYSETNDKRYVLLPTDFLINRVGTSPKTMSMLGYNDFQKDTIVISQNFIFARPRHLASDFPLPYLHFLLQISVEMILKKKEDRDAKQQYLTVKDLEDFEIPTSLLKIDAENEAIYKKFENLNNDLDISYSNIINTINLLNEKKNQLVKFKKEHFESVIELANKGNENE